MGFEIRFSAVGYLGTWMPVARAGFRCCSSHFVASARKRKRIAQPARADANNSPALTGRPPYISANFKTLLDEIMHAPPPQLPKFSSAFNDLLARCLAKDPATRMSLSEVLKHPFWDVKFPPLSLPDQPLAASSGHAVDVLRLSRAMVCPLCSSPPPASHSLQELSSVASAGMCARPFTPHARSISSPNPLLFSRV